MATGWGPPASAARASVDVPVGVFVCAARGLCVPNRPVLPRGRVHVGTKYQVSLPALIFPTAPSPRGVVGRYVVNWTAVRR